MKSWRREHGRTPGSASRAGPELRRTQLALEEVTRERDDLLAEVVELREFKAQVEGRHEEEEEEAEEKESGDAPGPMQSPSLPETPTPAVSQRLHLYPYQNVLGLTTV